MTRASLYRLAGLVGLIGSLAVSGCGSDYDAAEEQVRGTVVGKAHHDARWESRCTMAGLLALAPGRPAPPAPKPPAPKPPVVKQPAKPQPVKPGGVKHVPVQVCKPYLVRGECWQLDVQTDTGPRDVCLSKDSWDGYVEGNTYPHPG